MPEPRIRSTLSKLTSVDHRWITKNDLAKFIEIHETSLNRRLNPRSSNPSPFTQAEVLKVIASTYRIAEKILGDLGLTEDQPGERLNNRSIIDNFCDCIGVVTEDEKDSVERTWNEQIELCSNNYYKATKQVIAIILDSHCQMLDGANEAPTDTCIEISEDEKKTALIWAKVMEGIRNIANQYPWHWSDATSMNIEREQVILDEENYRLGKSRDKFIPDDARKENLFVYFNKNSIIEAILIWKMNNMLDECEIVRHGSSAERNEITIYDSNTRPFHKLSLEKFPII
ncbi:hypothetical protein AGMMS50276_32550 [Synergistales bacterium]|nr:hypothetical protein AGMMS50276_32550 [Synergistales bacterium]